MKATSLLNQTRSYFKTLGIAGILVLSGNTSTADPNESWMEDNLYGYRCQTLETIAIPASHDSAMYDIDLELTQIEARLSYIIDSTNLYLEARDLTDALYDVIDGIPDFEIDLGCVDVDIPYVWEGEYCIDFKLIDADIIKDPLYDIVDVLVDEATRLAEKFSITQDLTIYNQLKYGIRRFDLRPKYQSGNYYMHHSQGGLDLGYEKTITIGLGTVTIFGYEINLGSKDIGKIGGKVTRFSATGPRLDLILNDVKQFMELGHKELVILNFSKYGSDEGFTDARHDGFLAMITKYLGPWLLTEDMVPDGYSLKNTPLPDLIGDQGRVIVLCESTWGEPDPLLGFWSGSVLAPGGSYTGKDDLDKMKADQEDQFLTNTSSQYELWWTLTCGVDLDCSVRDIAGEANPHLWEFVEGLDIPNPNGNVINQIWVDFVEDTWVTDLVIDLNNQCPECDIDAPSSVMGGTLGVKLDGSGSFDPDADEILYSWVQTGGPVQVDLTDADEAIATFDAPTGMCGDVFEFTLTITDEHGASSSCLAWIEVRDDTAPVISVANIPATILQGPIPVTLTAEVTDGCDDSAMAGITNYRCYHYTRDGKTQVDRSHRTKATIDGLSLNILKKGNAGTIHSWVISAVDAEGNVTETPCSVEVVPRRSRFSRFRR